MISSRLLSLVLAIGLLGGTAGCTWFPEPPAEMIADTSRYEEQVRALPGVRTAKAELRPVDLKDKPGEFFVSLVVATTDASGLATVPGLVAGVPSPSGLRLDTVINVPKGPDLAPVSLVDSRDVERAEILRALSIVELVRLGDGADVVQVAPTVKLTTAVEAIRESGTLTSDPFDNIAVGSDSAQFGVAVSLAGPSIALIAYIETIRSQVDSIFSSEPDRQSRRPVVRVEASDPAPIAEALAALADDERDGRPRTGLDVYSGDDRISGFVGLPLGAPEPDDLRAADPTPPPVDEAAIAAQVAGDIRNVTQFLLAAAVASDIPGIPAMPEVFDGTCSSGDAQSQVQGTLLLSVFDYVDSADGAYDAIVESWEAEGYTQSDQAMGTSFYTPITRQPVVQASIRGTSEGIRLTATAACGD